MADDKAGDGRDIVEVKHRHIQTGYRLVAGDGDDMTVPGGQEGLTKGGAMDLQFGVMMGFETLDQDQIDRGHMTYQRLHVRLGRAAQFVHERPAVGRGYHDLHGAGGAVAKAVLAGLVDVKMVVGMLEGRKGQSKRAEAAEQGHHEGGLTAATTAGEAEDVHGRRTGGCSHGWCSQGRGG